MKKLFGLFLVIVAFFTVVSCGDKGNKPDNEEKVYTYNTYTTISPSNWNELTYQDNNDTQIMSYIGSSFFQYNYKFDSNGDIVDGDFAIEYSAATKLEDVSAQYVGEEYGIQEGEKYRAYKITLRNDLKWDDGTAIDATDFVYTMEQQLDPKFQNYRADSFYVGGTIIHNAEGFAKQGTTADTAVSTLMGIYGHATIAEFLAAHGEEQAYVNWDYSFGQKPSEDGWVATTDDDDKVVDAGMNLNQMYSVFSQIIASMGYDQETADAYFVDETYAKYLWPEMSFDQVGIFANPNNKLELIVILDKALPLLKEDGSLSYQAAYNFSSLPLVKRDVYEANKVAPAEGSLLWTSTYNSDVDTTASWGPYRLTSFQTGKQYILQRNPNWFGYNDPQYAGQYQTDRIVCDTIGEWGTAWLQFKKGNIDGIGIDVSIAADYKGSERAYHTPDDFVGSMQLQSSKEALEARQSEGVNRTMLTYIDFRQALSLAVNRAEYASKTTTSSQAGFGLFNSMHYYDVANGKVYRNEDVAKQVLCEVYGVNVSEYSSLEEAYNSITGYNLKLARELVTKAYNQALADGAIKETDKVALTFGTGAINEAVTRQFDFIKASWIELVKTTPLEGRLVIDYQDFGKTWANDFRSGKYDVCFGGWTGAAWDPGYFLLAYLSPAYMYSAAWDTSSQQMTFTMPGVGENGEDVTDTMSLMAWYNCLNSVSGAKYYWGQGHLEESKRLLLIAALEKEVLKMYYSVPITYSFGSSLLSYKVEYISYTYNTFMGYGGIRYMTFKYSDAEWEDAVADAGGELDYK